MLAARHEVVLFEARPRLGGHTHTVRVEDPDGHVALDTGFMIFNDRTYPLLTRLFARLGVPTQTTDMSFSVECGACELGYAGRGLRGLFAQKRNLLRPRFLGMLADIRRLARHADALGPDEDRTLDAFLDEESFGRDFRDHYLVPMASALWSSGPSIVRRFPVRVLLEFFRRHGLLRLDERLEWKTVPGGSSTYVERMAGDLGSRVHTEARVTGVRRIGSGVEVRVGSSHTSFDHVVVATHADQALALLDDPRERECDLLGAWRYSRNDTWLHTDSALLPALPDTWSAWNYRVGDCRTPGSRVTATYGLNRLQRLESATEYLVTLNPVSRPEPSRVIARMSYRHPMMTPESTATWGDLPALNDGGPVWFVGAYFGHGFHEDGLRSAVAVAEALGATGP